MSEWTQELRERLERVLLGGGELSTLIFGALSEIDRLTARVEALEGELRQIAWMRPAGHTNNKLVMQIEDIAIAALTPPPGEEPAQTNFDRIMDGVRDAQAWADAKSEKPHDTKSEGTD